MGSESKGKILLGVSGDLCRVCLASNKGTECIFRTAYDFLEKLRLCGGVEVEKNDGLPAAVCTTCLTKINDAYDLRKQCQKADVRLRELYGKAKQERKVNSPMPTKDQCCQTEYPFADPMSTESNAIRVRDEDVLRNSTLKSDSTNESGRAESTSDSNDRLKKQKVRLKYKIAGYEKMTVGRDAYRTRRMTTFKRVTSIERLKSRKERQRKYIKKNTNVKRESLENDRTSNAKEDPSGTDAISDSRYAYVCPKCTRCYFSKKSLEKHVSTHEEKKFRCEKCSKRFFLLDELRKHHKLHETRERSKSVLCKICNKNFRKTDTMVRHLNVHKRANPKEVLSILKEIRDKRKLEYIGERTKEGSAVDGKEDVVSTIETSILQSESNASKEYFGNPDSHTVVKVECLDDAPLYRCEHCAKRYASEKSLQRHLVVHGEKKYVCSVCNMKFFRLDRLKSHKTRYGHDDDKAPIETQKPSDDKSAIKLINSWIREELDSDNEEKGFPCKICGKSYDTKKSLSKHQLNSHEARTEGCGSCGKTCTCAIKGGEQVKSSERSKPYRCEECDKSFEKEVKLQRHARIHERAKEQQDVNFKRFLCHICSKTFRQNTGLMFHMRTHTGYKPHVCKYCGRGFTSNSNCINHERTHTGDRPFVCHFCSAAFAKSCTLKAHITTHTGEANYHCKTCGKSFRRLKYLKEHRFTHTGEKPYACKICGTAYSHSGSLFVHEKKCKAQYNNYQSNSTQNTQSYCSQPQSCSPTVTPIITALQQPHSTTRAVAGTLSAHMEKAYVGDIQRMNAQSVGGNPAAVTAQDLNIHPNSDISDVSSAVRNFALIGQMFHS